MPISNDQDFRRMAELYRDGRIPESMRETAMQEMRAYDESRRKLEDQAEEQQRLMAEHDPDKPWYRHNVEGVKQIEELSLPDYMMGVYELVAAGATGIIADPASGYLGAAAGGLASAFGKDGTNAAAKTQELVQGFLTNDPEGEAMKTLGAVAQPGMEYVTEKVDNFISKMTNDDPEAATGLKTAIYGIPSIVGLGKGKIPARVARDIDAFKTKKRVVQETEQAGYTLDSEKLPGKVREKAHGMAPDPTKGAGWDELRDALLEAEQLSKKEVSGAYDAARQTQAFVALEPVQKAAVTLGEEFAGKYNLIGMPRVQEHLDSLGRLATHVSNTGRKLDAPRTEMPLNELDLLRQRIVNDIEGGRGVRFTPQDRALIKLKKRLDSTIDDLWQSAAISGDPAAQAAWQKARRLAAEHGEKFDGDKQLRKMLLEGATPEDAYRLVMGSSAMNAKVASIKTVRSIKKILGPTHPVVDNIRKAMLRDILEPVLRYEKVNYGELGRNIEKFMTNHATLAAEVGIDTKELWKLRRAAHVANETIKLDPEKFGAEYVNSVIASVIAGHDIARKGAFVRTMRKLMNRSMGVGLMSKGTIKKHLLEAEYNTPMVELGGIPVRYWLAQHAATDLSNQAARERMDETEDQEYMP